MKKYVKPELFYEHYELSQHIADCAWELTTSGMSSCSAQADPVYLPGLSNLFLSAAVSCVYIPKINPDGSANQDGNYENYCYHDGTQGVNVFAS